MRLEMFYTLDNRVGKGECEQCIVQRVTLS
jgi:hypothetical protein